MDIVSGTGYLVLVPDIRGQSNPYVYGIRIDRFRRMKPSLNPGEVVVRVKLNFSKRSLIESIPTVELDVSSFITAPAKAAPESAEVTADA